MEQKRQYNLDNPEDSKIVKEHFLAQSDFRAIKIHNKYFIQYKTLKVENSIINSLEEVVQYAKLTDEYYFENEKGFNSLKQAEESLLKYLNAPSMAVAFPIGIKTSK